jgi:hypothetical protein
MCCAVLALLTFVRIQMVVLDRADEPAEICRGSLRRTAMIYAMSGGVQIQSLGVGLLAGPARKLPVDSVLGVAAAEL